MANVFPTAIASAALSLPPLAAGAADFSRDIAPLLESRCVECHGPNVEKSGFALHTRELLLKGGEGGAAVDLTKPASSALLKMVSGPDPEMPKKGDPLTEAQVALLAEWVADGAPWPEGKVLEEPLIGDMDWWSLKPVAKPEPPAL